MASKYEVLEYLRVNGPSTWVDLARRLTNYDPKKPNNEKSTSGFSNTLKFLEMQGWIKRGHISTKFTKTGMIQKFVPDPLPPRGHTAFELTPKAYQWLKDKNVSSFYEVPERIFSMAKLWNGRDRFIEIDGRDGSENITPEMLSRVKEDSTKVFIMNKSVGDIPNEIIEHQDKTINRLNQYGVAYARFSDIIMNHFKFVRKRMRQLQKI